MRTKKKEQEQSCPYWITDIQDFFGIISDEERESLYWCYEQQPNYSVFHAPYNIPIYIIHGVSLMRFECDFGEWFVLAKHSENGCLNELPMVDRIMRIITSDETRIEEMERIYKETAQDRNAAHEMAKAIWTKEGNEIKFDGFLGETDRPAEIDDFEMVDEIIKECKKHNLPKVLTATKISYGGKDCFFTEIPVFYPTKYHFDEYETFSPKEIRRFIKAGFLVKDDNGVLWDKQSYVVGKYKCSHEGIKECKE